MSNQLIETPDVLSVATIKLPNEAWSHLIQYLPFWDVLHLRAVNASLKVLANSELEQRASLPVHYTHNSSGLITTRKHNFSLKVTKNDPGREPISSNDTSKHHWLSKALTTVPPESAPDELLQRELLDSRGFVNGREDRAYWKVSVQVPTVLSRQDAIRRAPSVAYCALDGVVAEWAQERLLGLLLCAQPHSIRLASYNFDKFIVGGQYCDKTEEFLLLFQTENDQQVCVVAKSCWRSSDLTSE